MYITMCLYITTTILLWVLSIYPFIKHYTIIVSIITIQFSHKYVTIERSHVSPSEERLSASYLGPVSRDGVGPLPNDQL